MELNCEGCQKDASAAFSESVSALNEKGKTKGSTVSSWMIVI